MSCKEHPHLMDLTQLRYLVIDEADRMISQGSFPQLSKIFDLINEANPPPEEEDWSDEEEEDDDDPHRMRSLPGIPGEAKVQMLDDRLLAMIRRQEEGGTISDEGAESSPEPQEMDDEEYEEQLQEQKRRKQRTPSKEGIHRQTFVYSATLTLPPSAHHSLKAAKTARPNKKRKKRAQETVDGAISEILERSGARGQVKIVDLTNSTEKLDKNLSSREASSSSGNKTSNTQQTPKLPPGLSLYQAKCTQLHKDMYLYAYLTTTKIGSSGNCLVFCNSIAAVRRVGETLKALRLPVRTLHAQMAQVSSIDSTSTAVRFSSCIYFVYSCGCEEDNNDPEQLCSHKHELHMTSKKEALRGGFSEQSLSYALSKSRIAI